MIKADRFNKIKAGDMIFFNSRRWRQVVKSNFRYGKRNKKQVFLTFRKVNGRGTTVYVYSDIKHKILFIISRKA